MIDLSELKHEDEVEATINNFRFINPVVYMGNVDFNQARRCYISHDGVIGLQFLFNGDHSDKFKLGRKYCWSFYLIENKNNFHIMDPRIEILEIKRKKNDNQFTPRRPKSFSLL